MKATETKTCKHERSVKGTTANVCQDCGAVWMPRKSYEITWEGE